MSLIAFIIVLALQGLIVGAFARLALPGKDPLTIPQTIARRPRRLVDRGTAHLALSGGREGAGLPRRARRSRC